MANILGIAQAALGAGSTIYGMIRGRKAAKEQTQRQKELQEHAKEQQLDIWNKTNYEQQMQHIKNAGLNPALMYGQSGTGGQTGSVGAGQAAQENVYDITNAINQSKMMQAQIELAKSQAEKNRAEAEKISGVDTAKATAETGLTNVRTQFEKIQTEVAGQTQEAAIRKIEEESYKMMAETGIAQREGAIIEATAQDQIKQIKEEAIGAILENQIKRTNVTLNEERIKQISNEILQRWEQLKLQGKDIDASMRNMDKLTEAMLWGAGIQATGNLVNSIVGVATKSKPLTTETTHRTIKRVGNETQEYKQTNRH